MSSKRGHEQWSNSGRPRGVVYEQWLSNSEGSSVNSGRQTMVVQEGSSMNSVCQTVRGPP